MGDEFFDDVGGRGLVGQRETLKNSVPQLFVEKRESADQGQEGQYQNQTETFWSGFMELGVDRHFVSGGLKFSRAGGTSR